jgi:tetratricopeptide (TPR) repeat protein
VEGETPRLEDLIPLYQAIAHGCCAGRLGETLNEIYLKRIVRQYWGGAEYYALLKLGAVSSELAALSWFFSKPFENPSESLPKGLQAFLLSQAGYCLRSVGRVSQALLAMRAALNVEVAAGLWSSAVHTAANLSETELLAGNVVAAISAATSAVSYADREADNHQMLSRRSDLANALHANGQRSEAERLFREAEQLQKKDRTDAILISTRGFQYCDLLLAMGHWSVARDRAVRTIIEATRGNWLLDIAQDTLTLGRAHFGQALEKVRRRPPLTKCDDANIASAKLDESVERLRASGHNHYLPNGLLARAAFRRSAGDWDSAVRDLDEVEEIAEPAPMRLYLCDMTFERARLAFARIEAFAPLNGMLEKDNPQKPTVPSADQIAELKSNAEKQLKSAADYIEKCGYHRRDEELAELQAVVRGEKKLADLPPRA